MVNQRQNDKVRCRTPTPGKKPVNIPRWKYDLIREAILKAVPRREPGVPFRDLPGRVREGIPAAQRKDLGSVAWHTTVVKLDMEVTGEIRRVSGVSPQRLVRC